MRGDSLTPAPPVPRLGPGYPLSTFRFQEKAMNRPKIALCIGLLLLAVPMFVSCKGSTAPSKTGPKAEAKSGDYNHDMSAYKKLAEEAMKLAKEDKLAEAFPKTKELEKVFDKGTEDMKKADPKLWTEIDTQMDAAIDATNPSKEGTPKKATAELQKFIDLLGKVPAK
jgi:hypothetical protein